MTWYVLKRGGAALIVMFVVSLLTFIVTRVLFPDPAQSILGGQGETVTPEQVAHLRGQLGLDRPLSVQYFHWLGDLLQGNLGRSFRTPIDVSTAIYQRLPVTIELMVLALTVAIILGMLLGIAGALFRGRIIDGVSSTVSVLALSLPNFFVAILLIYVFALKLQVLPSAGWVPLTQDIGQNLKFMLLPAVTLSLAYIGTFARYARALMIGVLSEDYVLRAHASGLSPRSVIVRHAMKNTSIPMVTVVGLNAAGLVGGAVVTESIFSLPGLGTLFTDSILGKDFPMLQGLILVITIGVVVLNLLVDLAYGLLDPRIKVS
ncbi:ABC transporter permease [Streptomyces carpinensis]|uniref:ABC transporter permease n=1 Tax=Streptomyces carpinensis TaxID=66369 RepID=A0ABV1VZQ8_9ACTN|nr:ABC transporter permease [Streptomyces carpinensis]